MNNTEKIEVLKPEVVGEQLAKVERDAGLNEDNALMLRNQFADYYNEITTWRAKTSMIGDPSDATCQKVAREIRLGLRKVRCEVENTRKTLKADSLARGKAIDGFANVLKYLCEPIEAQLLDVETYAEKQEAARIAAIVEDRTRKLVAIGADPSAYNLAAMDAATFDIILSTIQKQIQERIEAAEKAEAERLAKEQAEAAERERIKQENERLKAEQAKIMAERRAEWEAAEAKQRIADEKIQKERDAAATKLKEQANAFAKKQREMEAKAKAERDAREKVEREAAEAKRKEEARIAAEKAATEAKAKAEKQAKAAAERAPDKEKINTFIASFYTMALPSMSTEDGKRVLSVIAEKRIAFVKWMEAQAEVL